MLPFHPDLQLVIGGKVIPVAIIARGLFGPKTIACSYNGKPRQWPQEIQSRIDQVSSQTNAYNGALYSVREFFLDYVRIDGINIPAERLTIHFEQTSYFEQLATDLTSDGAFRKEIYQNQNAIVFPVKDSATILGLNATIITKDRKLLITERSSKTAVGSGMFHTSMGTNIQRLAEMPPNLFEAAAKGIQEELGIVVIPEVVEFRTFTVNENGQYSLMTTVLVEQTAAEINSLREKSEHGWENKNLHFIDVDNFSAITSFINARWNNFFPVGLVAVIFSLFDMGYSMESLIAHFQNT